MGNSSSRNDDPDYTDSNGINDVVEDDPFDGVETLGYRVLGVQPNSPASKAGLVSFLDFLIGCNDQMLLGSGENLLPGMEYDDIDLPTLLSDNKDKELEFLVYNIKSQEARVVQLTPNDTWGGAGLLGVTIRLDNYAGAEDRFIRVLSIVDNPNCPAAVAGLMKDGTDFILGTTHYTINSLSHFASILQDNVDRIIELYVYNSTSDVVRVVTLMPSYEWNKKGNGTGLLGAEVGTGYLHRLPYKSRSTSGSCVERKVRYVPTKDTEAKVVLLEDAPVMEMEPPDHDDDDEDDENAEEMYVEPKKRETTKDIVPEQVTESATSEDTTAVQSTSQQVSQQPQQQQQLNVSEQQQIPPVASTSGFAHTALPPSYQPTNGTNTITQPNHQSSEATSTTAAVTSSKLFGQPLVPPPPALSHHPPGTSTTATTTTSSKQMLSPLGPPPPPAYGHATGTNTSYNAFHVQPQMLSYGAAPIQQQQQQQQQQYQAPSYYYGVGQQQQQQQPMMSSTNNYHHYGAYGVPTSSSYSSSSSSSTTAILPPPPPVGGVYNHATSTHQ